VFSTFFSDRGREDNAMKELREEIKNVIRIIAQEYVEQYPVSTVSAGGKRLISSGKIRIELIYYDEFGRFLQLYLCFLLTEIIIKYLDYLFICKNYSNILICT
jgi:hypothetical protein